MPNLTVILLFSSVLLPIASGQVAGTTERVKVHGKSLEGNLSGDSADRDVSVYLPPSYSKDTSRRYPVLYMLHGFTDSDDKWFGLVKHWISLPPLLDKALRQPGAREMIVVMPNAFTRFAGSMYSNSVTTGDWESFVSRDLVAYVDSHYRTIPDRNSRGLAGHSMGGYGTVRIGMRHPDVFSSIYALSPCCMEPPDPKGFPGVAKAEEVKDPAAIGNADFMTKAMLASAAAWSPNPKNPPLYIDLLWSAGKFQPSVAARWTANAPLAMADQYISNLKQLKAIAFDAGDKDEPIATTTRQLHSILERYELPHSFEIYDGDHVNHIAERIETKVITFFSSNLAFGASAGAGR